MTMRLSTGLRNFLSDGGSIGQALRNGRMEIYSGPQPSSADALVQGTLLCTITNNAGVWAAETPSQGAVTLTGSAGSVNTVTVGGVNILPAAVPFNGTLVQTMNDVVAAINAANMYPGYVASTNGTIITLQGELGAGTVPNGLAVACTTTTLAAAVVAMSGGVNAVNGLQFAAPVNGGMSALAAQVWSGVNGASGTAGWFRQYSAFQDVGALDSTARYCRVDGAIATSGAEMNLNNTAFTSGATTTIAGWVIGVPAQ